MTASKSRWGGERPAIFLRAHQLAAELWIRRLVIRVHPAVSKKQGIFAEQRFGVSKDLRIAEAYRETPYPAIRDFKRWKAQQPATQTHF